MKHLPTGILIVLLLCTVFTTAATIQKRLTRPHVDVPRLRHGQDIQDNSRVQEWLQNQQSILDKLTPIPPSRSTNPSSKMFSSSSSKDKDKNVQLTREGGPIISDVLPKTRAINTYASLTRDFDSALSHLNDTSKKVTVLAPRNSAIHDLPHKPWENPEEYERLGEVQAYAGREGQDRAKGNLKRFVEAHIVPVSPWREGEEVETLGGKKVKWTKDGDRMIIQPGNVEVSHVAEQVSNGEVWILNGVINSR